MTMLLDLQRAVDGVKYDYSFAVDADLSIYDGRPVTPKTQLIVTGYYVVDDDVVSVTGDARVTVVAQCDRCLESVVIEHVADYNVIYDKSGDDGTYIYTGYTIDLTNAVNEALTFTFPSLILCNEDCKGLCPYCGCNLNDKECNCRQELADKNNPFSILKEQLRR